MKIATEYRGILWPRCPQAQQIPDAPSGATVVPVDAPPIPFGQTVRITIGRADGWLRYYTLMQQPVNRITIYGGIEIQRDGHVLAPQGTIVRIESDV